jgi:hypothetical protein
MLAISGFLLLYTFLLVSCSGITHLLFPYHLSLSASHDLLGVRLALYLSFSLLTGPVPGLNHASFFLFFFFFMNILSIDYEMLPLRLIECFSGLLWLISARIVILFRVV